VRDAETSTCSASNSITTPDCNTSFCELTANVQQNGSCNQGNVNVNLNVVSLNGGNAGFSVTINGSPAPGSPYQYTGNNTTVPLTLVGNGQTYNLVVTDVQDGTCSSATTFDSPDCSIPCSINNLI